MTDKITITAKSKVLELTPEDYPVKIETVLYVNGEWEEYEYKLERHVTGSQRISEKKKVNEKTD